MKSRSEKNTCVDEGSNDGVDKSIDGDDKHLTHLTQDVGCCLKVRSEQMACVDEGKEDYVDNSVDDGDIHLTHLSQGVGC